MFEITTLKNGLTLITVPVPTLKSVTTLVAVGAGSRYETKKNNGISHFLEHMFFKGSKKYPTTEIIATLIEGVGAINNAATWKEWTYYWVKSANSHIELATDITASMLKEPLFDKDEIEREKGVIDEELRMHRDMPARYVSDLYEKLQFGDQPIGWEIGGDEKTINSLNRKNFSNYLDSLYSPSNMVLVYAGKLPRDIQSLAEKYFLDLPEKGQFKPDPYKAKKQTKPEVDVYFKQTDQANLVLGVEGYGRNNDKKYPAQILGVILGAGMSSRLFIQVRERRGLAYRISASHDSYLDTGTFTVEAGLKLEKIWEGLEVIKAELERTVLEKVTDQELGKAKEVIRGKLAISSESTNFLAEYFGTNFVLDKKIETFEEFLKKIDAVSAEDVRKVAKELINKNRYNLQIIGPFKETDKFEKLLAA